ncbi:MAG: hypothetical protein J0L97_03575 [Alphaproteobacteria bacterium]|nr:hypothetical protein [Alphaproteobacteria bacterium]
MRLITLDGDSIELHRRDFGQGWFETLTLQDGGIVHFNNTNQLVNPATVVAQTAAIDVYSASYAEISYLDSAAKPQSIGLESEVALEVVNALRLKRLSGMEVRDHSGQNLVPADTAAIGALTA